MAKGFASAEDTEDKTISFTEIGKNCYAMTAEGDPNSGVIIGDDSVMVIDATATPATAQTVIDHVREITDKPIKHVVLTHYHAVRVLGASAFEASEIVCSDLTRQMIEERGEQDWASEYGRMPRLFKDPDSIPGLTWPTMTFATSMSIWLGKTEVRLMNLGRGHTMGDIAVWVPGEEVMFSGDLVEYKSACYCGDAHLQDWPNTLDRIAALHPKAIVPGRGDALTDEARVKDGIAMTRDFVSTLYGSVSDSVEQGRSLKEAFEVCREAMDPKFSDFVIYEHCLPFNVARAYDEASGISHPKIWTDQKDQEMWASLQD